MALAAWKDLCIDVVDAEVMGRFWAETLGLDLHVRDRDDMHVLTGPTDEHTVWLNAVPEPVTAKQRVHLDVHAGSVADVLGRGATPQDVDSFRWKVLRDPEGGELCVFERDEVPTYRLYELGVDSYDPRALAAWWGALIGGAAGHDDEHGWSWVEEVPGMPFECIVFAPVPEPKTVKNRIHVDVLTGDLAAVVASGARVVREPDDEISWTVFADPEGNEFCVS